MKMQTNKKIIAFLIPPVLIFLLSSCHFPDGPVKIIFPPDPAEEGRQNTDGIGVAKRFRESSPQGPTAVESAIELSEKYARLSEQAVVLQQKNRELIAENHRLKTRSTSCQAELNQTQKELTEANDLLIEMRIELNNWKTDILGFRNEMRDAEKAQLETLLKVLTILGGEVKAKSGQNVNERPDVASVNQPGKPQLKETPASGISNE
jgi:chromosome segregation ATPase